MTEGPPLTPGARITDAALGDMAFVDARGVVLHSASGAAELIHCVLADAELHEPALGDARFVDCQLQDLRVQGGELGRLDGCDLRGAHLTGVRVRALRGCSLRGAVLERCDLSDADLRGSDLSEAQLEACDLTGAHARDLTLHRTRGLSAQQLRTLTDGGAWLGPPGLARRLSAHLPGSPLARQRQAATVTRLGVLSLPVLALILFTMALRPPAPPRPDPLPPGLEREPTAQERERTQASLVQLRDNLNRAHARMEASGARVRTWPTIRELQDNRFDVDGDGPQTRMEELVPGGLPENFLSPSNGGVLPYCNAVPDQATLAGVDTDWHYCETSGRVFASAAFTDEATLNW